MAYIYKLFKIDIGRVINYNQEIHQSYQKEGSMSSPRARYIFKEALVMEAANYALLAAAVSIILRIVVALVGGAV